MDTRRGNSPMNDKLSLAAVLRGTFSAYVERAPLLLAAALMLVAIVRLDTTLLRAQAAVGAGLINLLLFALFVCFVVLAAQACWDERDRHGVRDLLRSSWSAVGRLLLVGVVVSLVIGVIGALESGFLIVIVASAAFAARANFTPFVAGVLLISVVLQLYLLTIWSVFMPVVVLERPRGLRALGRSRELVRGNRSRVLVLILALALQLFLLTAAVGAARHLIGGVPVLTGELVLAMLMVPVPALAMTALYHELRRTS